MLRFPSQADQGPGVGGAARPIHSNDIGGPFRVGDEVGVGIAGKGYQYLPVGGEPLAHFIQEPLEQGAVHAFQHERLTHGRGRWVMEGLVEYDQVKQGAVRWLLGA